MEPAIVHDLPKEQPSITQPEFQRAALLLWLTQVRSQPTLVGPIKGSAGGGRGPEALYHDLAMQIISKYSLKSLEETVGSFAAPQSEVSILLESILKWGPSHGGFPGPHIHYAGKMYVVNEAQWDAFSQSALKALGDKLGKAGKVTSNEFSDIANAVSAVVAV